MGDVIGEIQINQDNIPQMTNNNEHQPCEVEYWLENITFPTDAYNDFEKWLIQALILKAPEFKEQAESTTEEDIANIRLLLDEAINETDYDLFVIKCRDCVKEYIPPEEITNEVIESEFACYIAKITNRIHIFRGCKIPVYDVKELRLALAYYIANQLKLAENASIMPVGGITEELVAGATKINPKTGNNVNLNSTYYSTQYNAIVNRRKIINQPIVITNIHRCCNCKCNSLCQLKQMLLKK